MQYMAAFSAPLPPTPRVLLCFGHPRANSLAIYGTLGIPRRVRSLYAAFRSHVFRRCLTGATLRYCYCGGVGEATWI